MIIVLSDQTCISCSYGESKAFFQKLFIMHEFGIGKVKINQQSILILAQYTKRKVFPCSKKSSQEPVIQFYHTSVKSIHSKNLANVPFQTVKRIFTMC